jgi:DNA-binding LacI/PurR family transcriptional regulator
VAFNPLRLQQGVDDLLFKVKMSGFTPEETASAVERLYASLEEQITFFLATGDELAAQAHRSALDYLKKQTENVR